MNPPSLPGQGAYEIVIKGHLDEQWAYWFEGLTIVTGFGEDGTPITTLSGQFVDQAALHGVLATIRDINVPLISVRPVSDVTLIEPNSKDALQAQSTCARSSDTGGAQVQPEPSREADGQQPDQP
jgi:hypothetical protein